MVSVLCVICTNLTYEILRLVNVIQLDRKHDPVEKRERKANDTKEQIKIINFNQKLTSLHVWREKKKTNIKQQFTKHNIEI